MRIIFIRHGEPDYERDCLTEIGREQAKAVAERLCNEEIDELWASPLGRAMETAREISDKINMPIKTLDFMQEVDWGSTDGKPLYADGHPWEIADEMAGYLPGNAIEGVFNSLSSLRSRDFWFNDFAEKCRYNIKLKGIDIDEVMKVLYECSAIGHIYSYNGGKNSRVTFKYRNRSSSFNPEDRIMLHKGLWKALNVNY